MYSVWDCCSEISFSRASNAPVIVPTTLQTHGGVGLADEDTRANITQLAICIGDLKHRRDQNVMLY